MKMAIINKGKGITINTDASWHPEYKVGGYAFTIVWDSHRIKLSGMLEDNPNNPTEAELMCIEKALSVLMCQNIADKVGWLVINTDYQHLEKVIINQKYYLPQRVYSLLRKVLKHFNIDSYEFRHVRAHTITQDKRSITNTWCDQQAKKHMRHAVKQLGKV